MTKNENDVFVVLDVLQRDVVLLKRAVLRWIEQCKCSMRLGVGDCAEINTTALGDLRPFLCAIQYITNARGVQKHFLPPPLYTREGFTSQ